LNFPFASGLSKCLQPANLEEPSQEPLLPSEPCPSKGTGSQCAWSNHDDYLIRPRHKSQNYLSPGSLSGHLFESLRGIALNFTAGPVNIKPATVKSSKSLSFPSNFGGF